jgi:hypothetical protein
MLTANQSSRPPSSGLRRWAIVSIAAVGCFLTNVSWHALEEVLDISRTISNEVPLEFYVDAAKAVLPFGLLLAVVGGSVLVGACIAIGIGRFPIPRRGGIAAFAAGGLISVGGFPLLSTLDSLHATSIALWTIMLAYLLGVSWILGRLISWILKAVR